MKLVRDNIPKIIEKDGETPVTRVTNNLYESLKEKLVEETSEFVESDEMEELADLQEVIRAILEQKGVTFEELENIRKQKKEERGGFSKGIILEGTE